MTSQPPRRERETKSRVTTRARAAYTLAVCIATALLLNCSGGDVAVALQTEVFFASLRDGTSEIYALDTRTSILRRLTNVEGWDSAPALSPNRRQVAFLSDRNGARGIWLMDVLGQSERLAFATGSGEVVRFFWAPDSRRIAFELGDSGRASVHIGEVSTGATVQLTVDAENVELGGWSPDNSWLLYSALDGPLKGIHRKTVKGVDDAQVTTGNDTAALWSPNGRSIAFNRTLDDGTVHLWVADSDGASERVLAKDGRVDADHHWSPDSSRLSFVSDRDGDPEVYVVFVDGRQLARLTTNQAVESAPLWSRDGKSVIFVSEIDGDRDLYFMNEDGTGQRNLTNSDKDDFDPYW